MRKLAALLLIMPLCLVQMAYGQNRTITGTITSDKDNTSLPGATVLVKGTTIGTVTDVDGKYVLSVPEGSDMLVVSFVGYLDQEVAIAGKSVVDVRLKEDVLQLNEVVVTAIGIKSEKRALNVSAQEVTSDQVEAGKNTNLMNDLNGKVAGLDVISSNGDPGSSAYITIRGNRSITGNNQPLIVIDGVPFDNSQYNSGNLNDGYGNGNSQNNNLLDGVAYSNRGIDLNPDDIESITVLKGAAASALYGSRAANGVIVITTKKGNGVPGTGRRMSVTYSSALTFDQVNKLPDLQNEYVQGVQDLFDDDGNGDVNQWFWLGPETGVSGSWGPKADTMSWDGSDYLWDKHGMLVSSNDPTASSAFTPYDNAGDFFQTGKTWDNNIGLSGGNMTSNYYFSLGQQSQTGIIPLSDFKRTSIRLNASTALSDKWHTSASLNYVRSGGSRQQTGSNISGIMLGLLRTPISFDDANGTSDPEDSTAYEFPDGTQRNYRGGGGYDNPYWTINKNPFTDDVNRMYGNTEIQYDPWAWLNITYRLGADFYTDRRKQVFAIHSRAFSAGQIDDDNLFNREINSDLLITLKKDFSDNLHGSLLLGNNLNGQYFQQEHAQGDGLVIPDYYNMQNATSILDQEYHQIVRTIGYFADAELNWKDMIYLGLTGRVDKASTFYNGDKSFFYPSANLGIVFTDLLGMSDNNILPYGKLRVSYAEVGTQPLPYLTTTTYTQGYYSDGWITGINFPYLGLGGFQEDDVLGNPDLGPENTKSFEIGADLRFLKNRIGLDFTYYDALSVDQIIPVPIAASSGFLQEVLNAAEVENSGVEISLNITPVKMKNFRWDILINYTDNNSMVNSLYPGIENINLSGFEGSLISVVAGYPYGQIYGSQWLKDPNGNIVLADDAAIADALAGGVNSQFTYLFNGDEVGYPMFGTEDGVLGDPNPDYIASLGNTFSWKGIELSFQWDQRKGGDIWNGTRGALDYFGRSEETATWRDDHSVSPTGSITFDGVYGHLNDDLSLTTTSDPTSVTVPYGEAWAQFGFGSGFTGPTEAYIEDGSYIRLREVNLSYTFSGKWMDKTPIDALSVGVSARNLILITDYTGVDPETSLVGAQSSQGLDYFQNPGTKSYGINLRVTL